VRAGSPEEAREIATALDALFPEVLAELPDARSRRIEVWVQEEPVLYRFPPSSSYREADGFFSERLVRIHLRSSADDVRRTLVHELVHASLGESWRQLPGTLEEGLCDVIAARLCPGSAARLCAGRLLAAALALGGFELEYTEHGDPSAGPEAKAEVRYVQHVLFPKRRSPPLDPLEVFRSHAGRSTESMPGDRKKALYGLAYLVAGRIIERRGLEGFHALVSGGPAADPDATIQSLLDAAGLTREPEDWRQAIAEAIGPAELAEISRILPGILVRPDEEPESLDGTPTPPPPLRLQIRPGRP